MKKRFYSMAGLLIVLMVLAACGSDTGGDDTAVDSAYPAEDTAVEEQEVVEDTGAEEQAASTGGDFVIVGGESSVRFLIDEVITGSQKTVVGETQSVEGTITADYANASAATISTITVDAGSFATDSSFRDKSIRNNILQSGQFPTITFTTTSISGLPDSVAVGDTVAVQVTGDLTIHGTTNQVTFDGSVTVVSDTELSGLLSLEITYADFGVQILRMPPDVASVADTVILEIEFVARK